VRLLELFQSTHPGWCIRAPYILVILEEFFSELVIEDHILFRGGHETQPVNEMIPHAPKHTPFLVSQGAKQPNRSKGFLEHFIEHQVRLLINLFFFLTPSSGRGQVRRTHLRGRGRVTVLLYCLLRICAAVHITQVIRLLET
jgi:hypothetical protein